MVLRSLNAPYGAPYFLTENIKAWGGDTILTS